MNKLLCMLNIFKYFIKTKVYVCSEQSNSKLFECMAFSKLDFVQTQIDGKNYF